MKRKLASFILTPFVLIGMTNAATVIGDGVTVDNASPGNPDGWSGITVLESAIIDSTTEGSNLLQATAVSMHAGDDRAAGSHHFIPLLVNAANEIAWLGPELTPTQGGLNTFAVAGAATIDVTGGPLRLGVWQWNDGVDDASGGTIAFAGSGGGGMFQANVNGTLGAAGVALGDTVTSGHSAPVGNRDYHIDLTVSAIPEPSVFPLIALSGLGLLLRRRRS